MKTRRLSFLLGTSLLLTQLAGGPVAAKGQDARGREPQNPGESSRPAAERDKPDDVPLALTRSADEAIASHDNAEAIRQLTRAVQRYDHHPLKAYWVNQLARLQAPSGLEAGDPLLPHYHWWRAMALPAASCNDGFGQYGRLSPLSEVLPSVPESTEIEARLRCAESLPEKERLAIARVLDANRYFWLLPRLLKNVTTPEGLWLQGESRMTNRDYRGALASFQSLLNQKSADGLLKKQALLDAGLASRRLGNSGDAQKWWGSIATSDAAYYPEVLWQRASLAFAANSPAGAKALLQQLIQRYPAHRRTPDALETLLRTAVENQSPGEIQALSRQIVAGWPETEIANTARYWLARTLEKAGKRTEARELYEAQAATGPLNNYYTHLARCRLNGTDCFKATRVPLRASEPRLDFLGQIPLLQTLVAQRQSKILEVVAPFVSLSPVERDLLKSWALRYNGHYFRSIRTIWTWSSRDQEVLRLMYPLHYDSDQKENAVRFSLPQALIAGLTWQESMYKADIRSPAGALGLMQLMPATAQGIAAKAGVPGFRTGQLVDPKVNIRLGSYYLKAQIDKWHGDLLPTIAAYNAGPGAASRWLSSFGNLDKDAFVEKIPYDETRHYVKQVLTHLKVYEEIYKDD